MKLYVQLKNNFVFIYISMWVVDRKCVLWCDRKFLVKNEQKKKHLSYFIYFSKYKYYYYKLMYY